MSGGGRSLANLLAAQSRYSYQVCGVVSSHAACGAVAIAEGHHLPLFIDSFKTGTASSKLEEWLVSQSATWIVLAGFIRPFPVLKRFRGKIINIHPALLPKFGGKGMFGMAVHQAVSDAREEWSGATVHFVTEEYDKGEIIAQSRVRVQKGADPKAIADLVFRAECDLLPRSIHGLVGGELPWPAQKYWSYDFEPQ